MCWKIYIEYIRSIFPNRGGSNLMSSKAPMAEEEEQLNKQPEQEEIDEEILKQNLVEQKNGSIDSISNKNLVTEEEQQQLHKENVLESQVIEHTGNTNIESKLVGDLKASEKNVEDFEIQKPNDSKSSNNSTTELQVENLSVQQAIISIHNIDNDSQISKFLERAEQEVEETEHFEIQEVYDSEEEQLQKENLSEQQGITEIYNFEKEFKFLETAEEKPEDVEIQEPYDSDSVVEEEQLQTENFCEPQPINEIHNIETADKNSESSTNSTIEEEQLQTGNVSEQQAINEIDNDQIEYKISKFLETAEDAEYFGILESNDSESSLNSVIEEEQLQNFCEPQQINEVYNVETTEEQFKGGEQVEIQELYDSEEEQLQKENLSEQQGISYFEKEFKTSKFLETAEEKLEEGEHVEIQQPYDSESVIEEEQLHTESFCEPQPINEVHNVETVEEKLEDGEQVKIQEPHDSKSIKNSTTEEEQLQKENLSEQQGISEIHNFEKEFKISKFLETTEERLEDAEHVGIQEPYNSESSMNSITKEEQLQNKNLREPQPINDVYNVETTEKQIEDEDQVEIQEPNDSKYSKNSTTEEVQLQKENLFEQTAEEKLEDGEQVDIQAITEVQNINVEFTIPSMLETTINEKLKQLEDTEISNQELENTDYIEIQESSGSKSKKNSTIEEEKIQKQNILDHQVIDDVSNINGESSILNNLELHIDSKIHHIDSESKISAVSENPEKIETKLTVEEENATSDSKNLKVEKKSNENKLSEPQKIDITDSKSSSLETPSQKLVEIEKDSKSSKTSETQADNKLINENVDQGKREINRADSESKIASVLKTPKPKVEETKRLQEIAEQPKHSKKCLVGDKPIKKKPTPNNENAMNEIEEKLKKIQNSINAFLGLPTEDRYLELEKEIEDIKKKVKEIDNKDLVEKQTYLLNKIKETNQVLQRRSYDVEAIEKIEQNVSEFKKQVEETGDDMNDYEKEDVEDELFEMKEKLEMMMVIEELEDRKNACIAQIINILDSLAG